MLSNEGFYVYLQKQRQQNSTVANYKECAYFVIATIFTFYVLLTLILGTILNWFLFAKAFTLN